MTQTTHSLQERVVIRHGNRYDIPFIGNSWVQSYAIQAHKYDVQRYANTLIDKILQDSRTLILVATTSFEADDLILGWVAARQIGCLIHYAYVKRGVGRCGVATSLMNALPFEVVGATATHLTNKGRLLTSKFNLTYNPYTLGEYLNA